MYDWQVTAVEQLRDVRTKGCLIRADEGTGKALEDNEPVLTTSWWQPISGIKVWDTLPHPRGGISTVSWVYPQWSRKIYKVKFSDATWSLCDYDHLWQVDYKLYVTKKKKYVSFKDHVITTKEIHDILNWYQGNKVYVPLTAPIEYPYQSLPIDPYCLWILMEEFSIGESIASCTSKDPQILAKMKHNIEYYWMKDNHWNGTYKLGNNKLKKDLISLWLWQVASKDLFIPEIYLQASIEQRRDMLRWLVDTNADIEQDWTVTFFTKSITLRDNVTELSRSLWCLTNLSINDRWYFTVNMFISENIFTSDSQRKRFISKRTTPPRKSIVSIEYIMDAPATCIKIDREDWLFITRGHTVTHNTRVMKALAQAHNNNVLIIAPTKSIIKQIKEEIPWVPVMSHVSLWKKAQEFNDGRTLIGDECFTAWTLVDWKPIEQIQVWDYVRSFNHTTNQVEYKKVIHCFKSIPKNWLANILYDNWKNITTTPDHPFRDWLEYKTEKTNMMLYIIKDNYETNKLQLLLNTIYNHKRRSEVLGGLKKKPLLFKKMWEWFSQKNIFWSNDQDKQEVCFWKDEEKQPYVQSWYKRESKLFFKKGMTQTPNTMMKLKGTNDTTSKTSFASFWSTVWIYIHSLIMKIKLISNTLQDRYCKRTLYDCYRNWLKQSQHFSLQKARQEKDWIFRIKRAESIEVLQQTSDGKFWWLCPDGYVYNIEVEWNNNYFVWEWVLVHNCHHLSRAKIKEFLQRKWRIVWLTATPSHEDFDIKGFKMMLGTIHETNATSLPVDIYFTRFRTDIDLANAAKLLEWYAPDSAEKRKLILYNDEARNDKIIELTQRLVNTYNKVIVFTDRVHHANIIKDRLSELLPNIFGIYWWEKYEDLYAALAPLDKYVLVCTRHAAGEWFNVPALTAWISCLNTSEYRVVRQMIWRVRRFAPGKDKGIWLDFYDTVSIAWGKKKYMDFPKRKKMYDELWFNVSEF